MCDLFFFLLMVVFCLLVSLVVVEIGLTLVLVLSCNGKTGMWFNKTVSSSETCLQNHV